MQRDRIYPKQVDKKLETGDHANAAFTPVVGCVQAANYRHRFKLTG
jgi:hypothetical protein